MEVMEKAGNSSLDGFLVFVLYVSLFVSIFI